MTKGFVYAMRSEDIVKIGWSSKPERRLVKINSDSPMRVSLVGYIAGTREQERELHSLLTPWRMSGEWYVCAGPVAEFLKMLPPRESPSVKLEKLIVTNEPRSAKEFIRALGGGSQRQMARALGVSQPSVCRLIAKGVASPEMAVKIEATFGIDRHKVRPDLWPKPVFGGKRRVAA